MPLPACQSGQFHHLCPAGHSALGNSGSGCPLKAGGFASAQNLQPIDEQTGGYCLGPKHALMRRERTQLFHSGERRDSHAGQAELPGQRPGSFSVELLNAYSHSVQAADLLLWRTAALAGPMRAPKPSTKPPWSRRERLDEREIAELITAYRNGATPPSSPPLTV